MVLKSVSDNIPATPGRAVRYLKSELEKKDAENASLQAQIADLTKALDSIKLVNDKVAAAPMEDKKGKKDKNAPKPAITAYRYFANEIKEAPGGDSKTGKELQQMWKECQGDARTKYMELATLDKKRFEMENAEYEALQKIYQQREQDAAMALYEAHQVAVKAIENKDEASKKKKKAKDPEAPKKAKSAYMFFCDAKRAEVTQNHPGKAPTEIVKILAAEWSKLTNGKGGKPLKKYNDLAAKDKLRYETEKAEFDAVKAEQQRIVDEERQAKLESDREEARKMVEEAQKEAAAQQQAIEAAAKKAAASAKPKKAEDKPKGPKKASTAFIYFSTENREKIKAKMPGASFADVSAEVGRQWGALSDKKKAPYVKKANKDKERYQKELDALKE